MSLPNSSRCSRDSRYRLRDPVTAESGISARTATGVLEVRILFDAFLQRCDVLVCGYSVTVQGTSGSSLSQLKLAEGGSGALLGEVGDLDYCCCQRCFGESVDGFG